MGVDNLLDRPSSEELPWGEPLTLQNHVARLQRDLAHMAVGVEALRGRLSRVGRPPVLRRSGVREGWPSVKTDLVAGRVTKAAAARALGISRCSINRLLAATSEVA